MSPPIPASASQPLVPHAWPTSLDPVPVVSTQFRAAGGLTVHWLGFAAIGRRSPRYYLATVTGPTEAGVLLHRIGVQARTKRGTHGEVWMRVLPAVAATLYRIEGSQRTEVKPAGGFYRIRPSARTAKGRIDYRLEAPRGVTLECVWASDGWPQNDKPASVRGDDEGFPPSPYPGELH